MSSLLIHSPSESATPALRALDALQAVLRGSPPVDRPGGRGSAAPGGRRGNDDPEVGDDVDEALAWAALDAAGVQGGWRDAVVQAGGPQAVLRRRALSSFASPVRRTRVLAADAVAARLETLRPWLLAGGRVVADAELARFAGHPVCCFYGFGDGRVPPPRGSPGGRPVVAIVGSRQAGPGWCARAERLAEALARAGVVVVSGGAPGIDRAAQRAARSAGGDVVVVHGSLARPPPAAVDDAGLCWLTPYGPWRTGARHLFAERNAWIAAAADVVVVVCGAARSGTRHTVAAALQLRRPVVTLVADADDPLGAIPRQLTARGAPVADDKQLDDAAVASLLATPWAGEGLALPGLDTTAPASPASCGVPAAGVASSPGASTSSLVRLLRAGGPLLLDEAAARLCVPVRDVLAELAALELDGVVRREGALLSAASAGP
jgi:predicted Rossmann fold nucleotide-binding protein DprA/Smf involved in DNA uptake